VNTGGKNARVQPCSRAGNTTREHG